MRMKNNSRLMNIFRKLNLPSLAWALRRYHVPIPSNALVLEVGSGGNPYPRANVLLDAYEDTRERHWVPLVSDRPTVLGFVENLPFKDNTFDYVIAAHVLEHSKEPEKFLSELQRVAKAGYIEVPDAFFERVNPYKDHRIEITCRDDTLLITKKHNWIVDPDLVELYEDRVKKWFTSILIPQRPFELHVRYYWENKINYSIHNPEVDLGWSAPAGSSNGAPPTFMSKFRDLALFLLRKCFSQNRRNKQLDITSLLRCNQCGSDVEKVSEFSVECRECDSVFDIKEGIYVMNN